MHGPQIMQAQYCIKYQERLISPDASTMKQCPLQLQDTWFGMLFYQTLLSYDRYFDAHYATIQMIWFKQLLILNSNNETATVNTRSCYIIVYSRICIWKVYWAMFV